MNEFYKEHEMLSAYIDGELSEVEVKLIEEKLVVSKDLQQKLSELKRLKELTQSSAQKVAESPYFETKLIANLTSENPERFKLKKWITVIGFSSVAIILMLFLRSNPKFFDNVMEEQKILLSGIYTENLKPLFVTAGLTNEDVFDFVLYRKLPLDKERGQYLFLGSNDDGSEFFEIKNANLSDRTDDFQKFVDALDLNEKQKNQMDSILESYANAMEAQVLVNDNNTVAINPKLWSFNKAIFADLMSFAKDANNDQFVRLAPVEFQRMDKPQLVQIAQVVKTANDSDYIFFTPDTIFIETFTFNKEKFKDELKNMKNELKENFDEIQKKLRRQNFVFKLDSNQIQFKSKGKWKDNFELFIDTNICRVIVPDLSLNFPDVSLPNLDELETQIEAMTKNLKSFSIKIPKEGRKGRKFEYDFNFPNFKMPFSSDALQSDSLSSAIQQLMNDSLFFNQKVFQHQMKEFQKEMQKLREEMLRLQKDLKKEQIETKKSEPIEI